MKKITIEDIKPFLGQRFKIVGQETNFFSSINSTEKVDFNSLDWINISTLNKEEYLKKTKANVIICDLDVETANIAEGKTIIQVENPNLVFSRIANHFFLPDVIWEVHKTATISPSAKIGTPVSIDANTIIGKAIIGKNTIIGSNVYIGDNTVIGDNVVILPGAVIGAEGFGFVRNEDRELEKFPQVGSVFIGNNVEIGANTCIDRGSLSTTTINDGVKINNLVHIAHNSIIGSHTFIGAKVYIGGSSRIGSYAWIAPSASIRNKVNIGNNTTIGLGSVVTKNIPDGEIWIGVPAKKMQK